MAIVVEQQESRLSGFVSLFIWLFILGVIGAAIYYIFFASPELIEIAAPESFKTAQEVSKLEVNPEEVLSDPRFQGLKDYVTIPQAGVFGRPNPFIGITSPEPPATPPRR